MKFADVEGVRREAQPGQLGKCPGCDHAMIAKCGNVRVPHWAHIGVRNCDPWWEETEWHRAWKDQFPLDWQEVWLSKDGEKHIADVRTERGVVLEFQHSPLPQEEREARERFYQKMVWVVDGRRLKLDRARFFKSLCVTKPDPLTVRLPFDDRLLRDWASSRVPVHFDFGDTSGSEDTLRFSEPVLWRLGPRNPKRTAFTAFLRPVTKASFLRRWLNGLPLEFIKGLPPRFIDYTKVVEQARAQL